MADTFKKSRRFIPCLPSYYIIQDKKEYLRINDIVLSFARDDRAIISQDMAFIKRFQSSFSVNAMTASANLLPGHFKTERCNLL
jgi:hypothetical protein